MNDYYFLKEAIKLSRKSIEKGGYPAGAVVVKDGEIIATGISNGKQLHDPTSHAETAAIKEASQKLGVRDLVDVVLYSSLEPCVMCYASSFWAHIPKIIFACGRNRVSSKYYEGGHNIHELNKYSHRVIELVHNQDFEDEAFNIIQKWERSKKF